jgi:hypothetical protein
MLFALVAIIKKSRHAFLAAKSQAVTADQFASANIFFAPVTAIFCHAATMPLVKFNHE